MAIFDPAEQQQMRDLRRAWLGGEKTILAEHRAQLGRNAGAASALLGKEAGDGRADAIRAAGGGAFGIQQNGCDDDLKRVDPRRSVFQRLNFIIGHVLILLRLRKPIAEIRAVKGKSKKEAA